GVTVPRTADGTFVRPMGSDTLAGAEVCLPGSLGPAQVAVLASLGLARVRVRRRPRVAVLSTGDELVEPGDDLRPGQIHDSNAPALEAARARGGGEPHSLGQVGGRRKDVEDALRAGAAFALLISSGVVSVGRHDHVRN